MAAQAGVAGSTKIGQNVLVGGQVGISGHIKVADRTQIVAQSGIPGSVKKSDTTLMGSPGIPIDDFKRSYVGFRRLPSILKRLQEIEEKDRKSTRLNSSHVRSSYAVFCLKKKTSGWPRSSA